MSDNHYKKLKGIERWKEFSLHPRTEEEIEHELLNNPDDVCMSFVCAHSKLSEEFIEKLKVLTAGCKVGNLISYSTIKANYDKVKKIMDYLYSIPIKDRENVTKHTMLYMPKILTSCHEKLQTAKDKIVLLDGQEILLTKIDIKSIDDKIDWRAIAENQCMSLEFIRKHKDYLNIKDLQSNPNISKIDQNALNNIFENTSEK